MGAKDLVRYREVRVADARDDQKTAAQIATADTSPVTQEDLQQLVLSQLKRIIYGDAAGHWHDDFRAQGIPSLKDGGRLLVQAFDYTNVGAIDFGVFAAGDSIVNTQVIVDVPFNDPSTLLSIGLASNPDGILASTEIDPLDASTYGMQANILVTGADALRLKVFPFSSTQGAGRVVALIG